MYILIFLLGPRYCRDLLLLLSRGQWHMALPQLQNFAHPPDLIHLPCYSLREVCVLCFRDVVCLEHASCRTTYVRAILRYCQRAVDPRTTTLSLKRISLLQVRRIGSCYSEHVLWSVSATSLQQPRLGSTMRSGKAMDIRSSSIPGGGSSGSWMTPLPQALLLLISALRSCSASGSVCPSSNTASRAVPA